MVMGPVEPGARGDRHARLGIADGGGKNGIKAKFAVVLRHLAKGIDGAGDGHGGGVAEDRHLAMALGAQPLGRKGGGRAARSVDRDDLLGAGGFDQREAIAADPGHGRFAQAKQHGTGNGGINGVATRLEDVDGGLSRDWVRGSAHAVFGESGRPAGMVKVAHDVSLPRAAIAGQPNGGSGKGKGR